MRIVQIEDFFHPDTGYQLNVLSKYLVTFGHEVTIITAEIKHIPDTLTDFFCNENLAERDRAYEAANGVKIIRLPLLAFISGRAIFTRKIFQTIKACEPDILFVHGNDTLTGMRCLWNRKTLHCPLIMDSHMLAMAAQNRFSKCFRFFYRVFLTPIIVKNHMIVIRTQNDAYVKECLGIPLEQAPWISYGSDTLLFHPDTEEKRAFRRKNNITEDDFVVIYAGKLDESKGGKLLAETFQKKFETKRAVVLIVVGNIVGDYGKEVEAIFNASENRILRYPTQKYCDLAQFYQAADLAVFAKQCSLSFYDAQACGLPVISEDNNINLERCSHGGGWNFKAGDRADFRQKIEYAANMDRDAYQSVCDCACHYIIEQFDYRDKAREYELLISKESGKA